ncbi:hypothetical protein [Sphaerisporangium fuscum]|uniref:hypothetical protein n=1 Tax=Sphaerisporangium fuscum TaxID=2835868 RepID=UPI001BDD4847|nr:hypothetical protein [Sphaerisporangium fuscum]
MRIKSLALAAASMTALAASIVIGPSAQAAAAPTCTGYANTPAYSSPSVTAYGGATCTGSVYELEVWVSLKRDGSFVGDIGLCNRNNTTSCAANTSSNNISGNQVWCSYVETSYRVTPTADVRYASDVQKCESSSWIAKPK